MVPSGASTGQYEALELRDGDKKKWLCKGVDIAVDNVRSTISETLTGMAVDDQRAIDQAMLELPDRNFIGQSPAPHLLFHHSMCTQAGAEPSARRPPSTVWS